MNGDDLKPAVPVTDLTPEQWQAYLKNAMDALHKDHTDREALQAIRDANQALGVYDEAEAASPGERIVSGLEGAKAGLGEAVLDIPRGIVGAITHPIETVKNLPKVPGALARGLSSGGDAETVARTVGDIGGMLLPFAKTGAAGSLRFGSPKGPNVAQSAALATRAGAQHLGRVARSPIEFAERPELSNKLTKLRIAEAEARAAARASKASTKPDPSESGATPDQIAAAKRFGIPVEQLFSRLGADTKPLPGGGVGRNLTAEDWKAFDLRRRAAQSSAEPDAVRTALVEQMGGGTGETMEPAVPRKQQGATKNQLAWRAEKFGLSNASDLQNTPYRDLTTQLKDPKVPLAQQQAIRQELARRGIAGFP